MGNIIGLNLEAVRPRTMQVTYLPFRSGQLRHNLVQYLCTLLTTCFDYTGASSVMYDYLIRNQFFLNNKLFGHTARTGYIIQWSITIQPNHHINLCDQNMSLNLHESVSLW
jgi:hypothetical protein